MTLPWSDEVHAAPRSTSSSCRRAPAFPFRYGIASMTDVPQVFVRAQVLADGRTPGRAGRRRPCRRSGSRRIHPRPSSRICRRCSAAIRHATTAAAGIARQPVTFFDLWRELDRQQAAWAAARGMAPLLAHLGVSLVERAVLDALCRALGEPLHRVRAPRIARPATSARSIPSSARRPVGELLPGEPLGACVVRHTVGLGDPLTAADVTPEERVDDGLPQDLESSIRAYGLRYFKIKLTGKGRRRPAAPGADRRAARSRGGRRLAGDARRQRELPRLRTRFARTGKRRSRWPALRPLWPRVLVVEQPVHRDRALTDEVGPALARLGRPSTAHRRRIRRRRRRRAARARPRLRRRQPQELQGHRQGPRQRGRCCTTGGVPARDVVLTGEDLANLGPVALLQDLAMMALLGVTHVERNGHHYYRGLSMFPKDWQEAALDAPRRSLSASRAGICRAAHRRRTRRSGHGQRRAVRRGAGLRSVGVRALE